MLLVLAACLSLVMYAATLHARFRTADRRGLGDAAAAMARALPAEAVLAATAGVPENDLVVLGYLLDRPILRSRHPCDQGATHTLVPRAREHAVDRELVLVDHPRASLLVRCPGRP